jgi:hypothetical protein
MLQLSVTIIELNEFGSQFTSMLSLVEPVLTDNKIDYLSVCRKTLLFGNELIGFLIDDLMAR